MALARSNRPLSPHLQIWRWGPAMLVSILHRVTGNGLTFVGFRFCSGGLVPSLADPKPMKPS
jgi:succinate dehydrogenase cytochrome b556 subunit